MIAPISFTLACLAFVAALVFAEYRGDRKVQWVAKPAASFCFVLAALMGGAFATDYGQWVLAALLLCAFGDVALIPKSDQAFLAGMSAFAMGHAAYIAGFLTGHAALDTGFFLAAAAMAAFSAVALRWLWPHLGAFRWPVAAYTLIIAMMVAASFIASPPGTDAPHMLVIFGAIGFAVSDLAVARDQFICRNFFNRAWGLPLYYFSQLMLAASV